MNAISSKLIWAGALFVLTLVSGFVVSQAGRPLNSLLFAIHKLVAVATIVLMVVTVVRLVKAGQAPAGLEFGIMIFTAALFLSLVVTGSLLSFEKELPPVVLKIHQIAPLLSLASSVATLYLLAGGRSLA